MRRILLVLTVALMVAVMMVAMAAPAFAGPPNQVSGNYPYTYVVHCNYVPGGEGSVVYNGKKNPTTVHGGGDC